MKVTEQFIVINGKNYNYQELADTVWNNKNIITEKEFINIEDEIEKHGFFLADFYAEPCCNKMKGKLDDNCNYWFDEDQRFCLEIWDDGKDFALYDADFCPFCGERIEYNSQIIYKFKKEH